MKSLVTFYIIILSVFILPCNAQITHICKWACSFGSQSNEDSYNFTTDSKGNTYVIGTFIDTMDFTCTQPVQFLDGSLNGYNESGFLVKYDSSGNFKWAQNIGYNSILTITSDASDNIYIFGNGCPRFNTTSGPILLCDLGQIMFFAKLDTNGICIWARALNATISGNDIANSNSISTDSLGNVYIAGDFTGTLDFDPRYPQTYFLNSTTALNSDVFLAKYNSSGLFEWVVKTTGEGTACKSMITDNSGNIYVGGYIYKTNDFDPSPDSLLLTESSLSHGIFLAKYNTFGFLTWAKAFNHIGSVYLNKLEIDKTDNIWVAGSFADSVAFNFDQPDSFLYAGSNTRFIAKYSNDNIFSWVKNYGGPGYGYPKSMVKDKDGNVLICTTNNTIKKFNSLGQTIDSISFGGNFYSSYAIPFNSGSFLLCGSFSNTITFPSDTGNFSFVSKGGRDIIVAKYNINTVGIPITDYKQCAISIYPNPVNESLLIEFHSEQAVEGNIEI